MFSWTQTPQEYFHFSKEKLVKRRVYLDFASATPIRKEVLNSMLPYFSDVYGNAGSIHKEGTQAHNVITKAREKLARVLRIRQDGIIFTASGTESNNLAIMGVVESKRKDGVPYADIEILSTKLEHASVGNVLEHLASLGVNVVYVQTDEFGIIQSDSLKKYISKKTALVTFAYVNSEIGTIQPVGKLARIVRSCEAAFGIQIYVHVDAAQAPLWLSCALDTLGADMVSLDAGKCYGPKGVGVLALRHGIALAPYMYGGDQEGGLRPGTPNTALIVGASESLCMAQESFEKRSAAVLELRDYFSNELEMIDGVVLNGPTDARVANNVNISISGVDSEFAVISLDQEGIACSTKSACGGARGDGSSVILAITGDSARATSAIRFTLGEETTRAELQYAVKTLKDHVLKVRTAMRHLC